MPTAVVNAAASAEAQGRTTVFVGRGAIAEAVLVVADTVMSEVDGEEGRLIVRGHVLEELVASRGFEGVAQRTDGVGEHVVEHSSTTVAGRTTPLATVAAMSLVLVDVADGVATLTLNNPEERNTLTAPMVAEIIGGTIKL